MINGFVALFGRSPIAYFLVGLTVLFAFVALASVRDNEITRRRGFDYFFLLVAGLTLLFWRWPSFLWQGPLNPDEGFWVAAAMKTTVDWVPWRGFDLGTSGPLSAYLLALPAVFGQRIDFFSTRLLGVCFYTITIAGLYYTVKWLSGPRVARLSVIPSVLLLALTNDLNFLHFSSEVIPIFLTTTALAAGAYLAGERRPQSCRFTAVGVAGLCMGSTGFAKIQSMPIALLLLIFVLAAIFWTHRQAWTRAKWELLILVLSLFAVATMIATVVWATGGWDYAIQSFFKHAIAYAQKGQHLSLSFLFETSPSYAAFFAPSLLLVLVAAGALAYRRQAISPRSLWLGAASLLLLVGGSIAICIPRREFPHYLLFSLVPVSCCVATILALTRERNLWSGRETYIASAYTSLYLIPALAVALSSPPNPFLNEMVLNSTWMGSNQAIAIARYARPGDRIAVWGSHPEYFVQTGTIMATRHPQLVPTKGPSQNFYERSMLGDLQEHVPRVFVDAVTPDSFEYNDRAKDGYETFPALASFVNERFVLKEEVEGVRIFVLKGN
jgi:hypothetical protein